MRHRIPAVSVIHGFVEERGLMSYAPSEAETIARPAAMVDRMSSLLARADVVIE